MISTLPSASIFPLPVTSALTSSFSAVTARPVSAPDTIVSACALPSARTVTFPPARILPATVVPALPPIAMTASDAYGVSAKEALAAPMTRLTAFVRTSPVAMRFAFSPIVMTASGSAIRLSKEAFALPAVSIVITAFASALILPAAASIFPLIRILDASDSKERIFSP